MVEGMNTAGKHLTSALSGHTLSGAAYTAGNGMFTELVIPAISKASSALDNLKSQFNQYKSAAGAAGGELLDEDKLNKQLQALQTQQTALGNQINYYGMLMAAHPENANNGLNTMYGNFQQNNRNQLNTVADDIQKVQDKLKKLYTFNDSVKGLFVGVKEDFEGLGQAIQLIGTVTFDKKGEIFGDLSKLLKAGIQFKNGKAFLAGVAITHEKGVLKWGKKVLYDTTKGEATKNLFKYKDFDGHFKNGKSFEEASAQALKDGIDLSDYKQMLKAGGKEFKNSLNVLDDFKGWGEVGKAGKFVKGLGALGTAFTVFDDASQDINFKDGIQGGEVRNFAVDTAVDIGTGAGAMAAGAAVGSLILPPLGTVVGAAVGVGVNALINVKWPILGNKTPVEAIKKNAKAVAKDVSDKVGGFANNVGKALSHVFW